MVAELRATRPHVIRALPTSWYGKARWKTATSANLPLWKGAEDDSPAVAADLWQSKPIGVMTPELHLRKRLIGSGDDYRLEIRGCWSAKYLALLLTPQGSNSGDFWEKIRNIYINFFMPQEAMGPTALPFQVPGNGVEWKCVANPTKASLIYGVAPMTELVNLQAHLPGSDANLGEYGFLARIAWADLHMPSPPLGTEFGFGLFLIDSQGGKLDSHPRHEAGRIRLSL
jgi:hypothetical protein